MSKSNIASTTYPIVKYSRSYPQPSGVVGAEEWQHFVNPVIRLALDVKKSSTGNLESFMLRVLWSLDSGEVTTRADQQDIVFEDVELLAFSSLASMSSTPQGFPLKAVYRDAVVGIRYLHPRVFPQGTIPTYRRFQVTFQTSASASAFIDSIRLVCPCKQNPAPAPNRTLAKASTMAPPASHPLVRSATQIEDFSQVHTLAQHAGELRPPVTTTSPWNPGYDDPLSQPSLVPPAPPPTANTPVRQSQAPVRHANAGASDKQAVTRTSSSVPLASERDSRLPSRPSSALTEYSTMTMPPPERLVANQQYSSSLPRSSSPGSLLSSDPSAHSGKASTAAPSVLGRSMPVPVSGVHALSQHTLDNVAQDDTQKEGLLAALEGKSTLYGLPRKHLEDLVAKVIREEGFAKLLEDLDSMWRIKGLINHSP